MFPSFIMSEDPHSWDLCWGLFSDLFSEEDCVLVFSLIWGHRWGVRPLGPGGPPTGGAWSRCSQEGLNLRLPSRKMPPGSMWGGVGGLGAKVLRGRLLTARPHLLGSPGGRKVLLGLGWGGGGEPIESSPEEVDQESRGPGKGEADGGWGLHLKSVGKLLLCWWSIPAHPPVQIRRVTARNEGISMLKALRTVPSREKRLITKCSQAKL